jgi:hypothetical protein
MGLEPSNFATAFKSMVGSASKKVESFKTMSLEVSAKVSAGFMDIDLKNASKFLIFR